MKFHVTDENGESCVVEEIEESKETTDADEDMNLTADEISMLKSLAANADKLLALLSANQTTTDEDVDPETVDKDEDKDIEDADEDEEDIGKEKVIDTDEDEEDDDDKDSIHDSVGSIKKSAKTVEDSLDDDVSAAWAKRYGGI